MKTDRITDVQNKEDTQKTKSLCLAMVSIFKKKPVKVITRDNVVSDVTSMGKLL